MDYLHNVCCKVCVHPRKDDPLAGNQITNIIDPWIKHAAQNQAITHSQNLELVRLLLFFEHGQIQNREFGENV